MVASLLFDAAGHVINRDPHSRDLRAAGFYAIILGAVASFAAVLTGLLLTGWVAGGSGMLLSHHLFLWPAFTLLVGLAAWRLYAGNGSSRRTFAVYLALSGVTAVLLSAAGFWGGEMVMRGQVIGAPGASAESGASSSKAQPITALRGGKLFQANCARCHGTDARGMIGPNLHRLDFSDDKIARTIHNGRPGGMPPFGGRLLEGDIKAVVAYIRSLPRWSGRAASIGGDISQEKRSSDPNLTEREAVWYIL
jgi:mono/diheme cytochrome c family protein